MPVGPGPGRDNIWKEQLLHDAFNAEAKAKVNDRRHHEDALRYQARGRPSAVEKISKKDMAVALAVIVGFVSVVIVVMTMI